MEIIFTKNSENLAKVVADKLTLSAFCGTVKRFRDNEMLLSLPKSFSNVAIIANTLDNESWIELFLLLDALRDAKNVTLCLTYMGYARQDATNPNESCGSTLFMRFLESFRISEFIFLDNHSAPSVTDTPFVHLSAMNLFIDDIKEKYASHEIVVVSADLGRAKEAQFVSESLKCEMAVCVKTRDIFNKVSKTKVLGNVKNKICILIDDIVDSGHTLCSAVESLCQAGAYKVEAYVVHGILSGNAVDMINSSEIAEITLTDSIENKNDLPMKFKKLSIAPLLIEEIRCILQRS